MSIYLVRSFRYGWLQEDSTLLITTSLIEARLEAFDEVQCCGGKYGVGVYLYEPPQLLEYYPSSRGEERPRWNKRIAMERELGKWVLARMEDEPQTVEVPEWLQEEYEHAERVVEIFWPCLDGEDAE